MTAGALFVENYIAGGADQVANTLIRALPFSRLTVIVNRADDTRILLAGHLPPHVTVERYGLTTIPELTSAARRCTGTLGRSLAKIASLLVRYPLFVFSILYFMWLIRRAGVRVFVANNGGYPGGYYCRSASIAASLLPGIKCFHVVHSMAAPPQRVVAPIERLIDRIIDSRCRFITVCRAAVARLKAARGMRQDAEVIYNGLAPRPWRNPDNAAAGELRIISVGYFDHNKNQEMLLRAMAELTRRGRSDIRVLFAGASTGDGTFEQCMGLAADFGLADRVEFANFVADIAPLYDANDVLVLCSRCEGLPMSILEAMRAGRAVVATDVGGVRELVRNGENGYVVPVDDHRALADALELLAGDRRLLARCGAAGRKFYEQRFTIDHMLSRYMEVLGLDGGGGTARSEHG